MSLENFETFMGKSWFICETKVLIIYLSLLMSIINAQMVEMYVSVIITKKSLKLRDEMLEQYFMSNCFQKIKQ